MPDPIPDLARPVPAFAFKVTFTNLGGFDATAAMYFKSVAGLKYETEVIPTPSGGENNRVFNLVGSAKWSNIILKRGFTMGAPGSLLLQFRESWIYGKTPRTRVDGTIVQLDSTLKTAVATWNFSRAWPVKWEMSEFDASKSEMSIETLELAHDGLKLKLQ